MSVRENECQRKLLSERIMYLLNEWWNEKVEAASNAVSAIFPEILRKYRMIQ
ncbi:MAG: hypothetical protein HQM10_17955 [Candidatus Riflebacteria bacterium]|nr:hypothetical protein [Candidatus Riflebacteria bacterium]